MLDWTISFLIISIIAGFLGFTTIAGTAIGLAKIVFYVFLILWLGSVAVRLYKGKNQNHKKKS